MLTNKSFIIRLISIFLPLCPPRPVQVWPFSPPWTMPTMTMMTMPSASPPSSRPCPCAALAVMTRTVCQLTGGSRPPASASACPNQWRCTCSGGTHSGKGLHLGIRHADTFFLYLHTLQNTFYNKLEEEKTAHKLSLFAHVKIFPQLLVHSSVHTYI